MCYNIVISDLTGWLVIALVCLLGVDICNKENNTMSDRYRCAALKIKTFLKVDIRTCIAY